MSCLHLPVRGRLESKLQFGLVALTTLMQQKTNYNPNALDKGLYRQIWRRQAVTQAIML